MACVAAVARVAGEKQSSLQVFALRRAIGTATTRCGPSHGTPMRCRFRAGDAMPSASTIPTILARRDRKPRLRQFAVDDVEVCAADSAGEDAGEFRRSGAWQGPTSQARAGRRKAHRAFRSIMRFAHLAAFHDPSSCAARPQATQGAPGRQHQSFDRSG